MGREPRRDTGGDPEGRSHGQGRRGRARQKSVTNANTTHLKEGIGDSRAARKGRLFDPAAAPLGADDEAAGVSPTESEIEKSISREATPRRGHDPISAGVRASWRPYAIYLVGIAATVVVVAVLFFGME